VGIENVFLLALSSSVVIAIIISSFKSKNNASHHLTDWHWVKPKK